MPVLDGHQGLVPVVSSLPSGSQSMEYPIGWLAGSRVSMTSAVPSMSTEPPTPDYLGAPSVSSAVRSGRCRAQMDLPARFTSADVAPMASVPRSAARRPAPPPARASAAAMANQRPELLAALESRRSGSSRDGVGAAATAE